MSVRNPAKASQALGKSSQSVTRKIFRGDPAGMPFQHNPETMESSRKHNPKYKENKEERAKASSPAAPSIPAHRGPTSRGKGISREEWCKNHMNPKLPQKTKRNP